MSQSRRLPAYPDRKRYRTYSGYLKELFGCRVHKISLDAGFTCPNRDGVRGTGGCIFCNNEGFSYNTARAVTDLDLQLEQGRDHMRRRFGAARFIAYFQAYSSTYAPLDTLRRLFDHALAGPDMAGLAVSTRPDCVPDEVLDLLAGYSSRVLVWLELGLQSANDSSLARLNRCHTVADFTDAAQRAAGRGIPVAAHVILGLPGEGRDEMLATARYLADLNVAGLKLHALHVLRGTALAALNAAEPVRLLGLEEYAALAADFLEHTRPEVVIQRLAADAPRRELIAPDWCLRKLETVNAVEMELERRDSFQGSALSGPGA
ncbi:TIGR01212 family radical SAM protein [bacterium]|nr:TIGR01212 family radical SAM protein [bacterium]